MQLGQLFSNLISNSLKFSPRGPVITITAELVSSVPGEITGGDPSRQPYHLIVFEDNGIGFEQQYSKAIFSLFQRLHGKQDYAGTGIGLALCKKIVENHNGFIAATSEPGKGARFSVYLPCNPC
jgi:signal transduction histidine kinase